MSLLWPFESQSSRCFNVVVFCFFGETYMRLRRARWASVVRSSQANGGASFAV